MSIAELSIKRPVSAIMLFVSLTVIGLIAAFRLPLEAFPEVSPPFIFVQLPYVGSTPEEVERTVLRPVEETLSTMPGIKRMDTSANADGAQLFIQFSDWERDVAIAASDARERIDAIRADLPDDLQRYLVLRFSTTDQPVLRVRLASDMDLAGSYDMIDREFKRRIERIPGVARVDISGAQANEVEIAINQDRLTAHNLGLNDLTTRLQSVNFSVSAGTITDGGMRLRVQPVGELTDLQQLRDLVIANGVRLSDIAEVHLKQERTTLGRRLDGKKAVGLDIFKERNANLVEVSKNALKEVEEIRKEPSLSDLQIKIIENQGDNVTTSLIELAEAGGIGLVLSIAVLFFFLRHWPSTMMVTLAIPICFIMTLGFMYFAGVTLNILSMMGLLLAIGMLVDNAVVVVESIYQERERMPDQPRLASIVGTRHVAIALSAGTLCHCIVFVPNLFGERNFLSIYLSQIAITISVSLLASWLVAVSLIPMLSARLKTPPAVGNHTGIIPRMQKRYAGMLRWTLEHRGWSVMGILLIIAVSIVPMMLTKKNMFGGDDGGETNIFYQWKGSYSLKQMSDEVLKVENFMDANRKRFHVEQIYSWYSEQGDAGTRIKFDMKDLDNDDTKALIEEIRKALPKSARATIGIGNDGGGPGGGGGPGEKVQVQLVGDSTETLAEIAKDIVPMLSKSPQLRDVRVDAGDQNSELSVRVDRERAAAFGFSANDVASFVGVALRGAPLREFRRGENEVPVWVRFAGAEQYGIEDLDSFMVRAPDGRTVPLLSMVDVGVTPAATQISRTNRQTTLTVQANLADKVTVPEARKAMEDTLKAASFPTGYSYSFDGGAFQEEDEAGAQMMTNLVIALLLIYIVMAAVFESLLFPAAIMSGVLFSVFGVFWLFWLTGTEFNIMAFIGILVLMGVVVNNGIVMIEHINNLRRRGKSRTDALVEGSRERLRPILMTMGTAILAMIPIAWGNTQMGGDGPPYYPMARAIAGGLAFSTVVSLLFLPTIYAILDDMRSGTARLTKRARARRGEGLPAAAITALKAE
ncbi:efflux RND transporter permease subunit [Pseudoxanthomonas sacheonensis]|uniref:HAE1 family hydrophobic/amphiphilic exporter-1 n=1 Tax=Pseudoxanthomonas sacheonensis TaxID=443615 RepID=A0ABU1RPT7_9GAMM|nr:efflux RND transporter permease subunit [Pseudoxanthomonas sacheonensis]MDR6840627.1 HAE1 family hydrophobic/amphiphilic exporter-1 [Pseudoxanthomonas sacheonensis]